MSHGSPPINGTASHRPCMRRSTRRSYPVRSALAAPHLLFPRAPCQPPPRAGQTPHGSGDLQATCTRVRQPLRANVRIEEGPPPPGAAARPPHARLTRGPPTVDPTWPPAPSPRLSREGGWGGLPQPRGEDEVHRAPRPTQGQTPPPWSPRASTLCPHPTPSDAAGAPPVCAPLWDCTKRHVTPPHERPIPCPQAVTRDAPVEDGAPPPALPHPAGPRHTHAGLGPGAETLTPRCPSLAQPPAVAMAEGLPLPPSRRLGHLSHIPTDPVSPRFLPAMVRCGKTSFPINQGPPLLGAHSSMKHKQATLPGSSNPAELRRVCAPSPHARPCHSHRSYPVVST